MAFMPNNLAVLSYAAGFTLWTYVTTEDAVAATLSAGYFDSASTHLRTADVILLNAIDGAQMLRVASNDGTRIGIVSIAGGTQPPPPDVPGDAILDEADQPILDEAGEPILQG